MVRRGAGALVLVAALAGVLFAAQPVSEEAVAAIARQLRCVVCQNLSVADSPSEMARQMRELIRERLAQGESRDQVVDYFVDRYGEWVLLSPRARGFNLLVWILPFVGLFAGLGTVLVIALRWSRRPREHDEPLPPADRERVRSELERLDDR
ncbi:MAG: cytochrome c-type biogenesis protein [Candidatus Rokuibacteriota bacterium]